MHDRSLLVTGAAGEIGGYLATEFLNDGWTVCGLDQRRPSGVDRQEFWFQECDLSDGADAENKIEVFHERIGAFDAVVNCAGLIANSPLVSFVDGKLRHHDFGLWNRVISGSLSTAFHVTACTVLKMVGSGKRGVIVNISSVCSRGNPGQVAYSAAKAGLNGLTAALAKRLWDVWCTCGRAVSGLYRYEVDARARASRKAQGDHELRAPQAPRQDGGSGIGSEIHPDE